MVIGISIQDVIELTNITKEEIKKCKKILRVC